MLHVLLLIVCLAATAVAGWKAGAALKAREVARATRLLGWALLPVGAYLAGLVTLVSRIGSAVSRWMVSLVFNPLTWTGVVILVVSAALILGTGFRLRRKTPANA